MKHAIVIGASSGIGREVVLRLIEEGWNVGIAARRQALLEELRSKAPESVTCREIDVCKDTAPEVLQELIAETGGMELFFYASGIGRKNVDLEPGIELSTVATNGLGFVRMVGEAYRYFSRHGGGHIVCITSVAGTKGLGMAPSYSATKAMQSTYLQALEQQVAFRHLNIRVTDIRPGFVDTELLRGDAHYPFLMNTESVADEIMDAIRHRASRLDYRLALAHCHCTLAQAPTLGLAQLESGNQMIFLLELTVRSKHFWARQVNF